MSRSNENIKEIFERDTEEHTMEILMDDGLYRHLKFSKGGSSVYRFDIHTWPGYLAVTGDMGEWMFSRVPDMFEFFIMDERDFNHKHIINPGYWAEKCVAADTYGEGVTEFSMKVFKENVMSEYESFRDQYMVSEDMYEDETDEHMAEAYEEDKQTLRDMCGELLDALENEVLNCDENGVRAYDAAMEFEWKSDDGELEFDMQDFWDYSNTDYTYHYIWILYAIVWGIQQYNSEKEAQKTGMVAV